MAKYDGPADSCVNDDRREEGERISFQVFPLMSVELTLICRAGVNQTSPNTICGDERVVLDIT